jgi:hypothetical protein
VCNVEREGNGGGGKTEAKAGIGSLFKGQNQLFEEINMGVE